MQDAILHGMNVVYTDILPGWNYSQADAHKVLLGLLQRLQTQQGTQIIGVRAHIESPKMTSFISYIFRDFLHVLCAICRYSIIYDGTGSRPSAVLPTVVRLSYNRAKDTIIAT